MITRRPFLGLLPALAAPFALGTAVAAEDPKSYPNRPIVIVCPYDAGGLTDAMTRYFGKKLGDRVGQPVVVENRPGASGMIGTSHVARQPADGYTLMFGSQSNMAANLALFKNVPYNPVKDFVPVYGLTEQSPMILVNAESPYRTIQDLIVFAKANPGKLNLGSPGTGTGTHLFAELFQTQAGVRFTHIPYRNTSHAMQAALGGSVDVIFDYSVTALPMIKAGRLRPLVYTGKERLAGFPDLPTVAEAGFPDAVAVTWTGFFAPAAVPPAIVQRLESEMAKIMEEPEVQQTAAERFGNSPMRGMGTARMRSLIDAEIPRWRDVVKTANITVE